jgi:hypothetical protein
LIFALDIHSYLPRMSLSTLTSQQFPSDKVVAYTLILERLKMWVGEKSEKEINLCLFSGKVFDFDFFSVKRGLK